MRDDSSSSRSMFLHAAFFQLWEGGSKAGQLCLGWKLSLLNPPEELRDLSSKIHNQFFPTARLEPFLKKQGNAPAWYFWEYS